MKLFDGSGEYIAAGDIKPGNKIRCPDREIREVATLAMTGQIVAVVCMDGFGFEAPWSSRILLKYDD